MWEALTVCKGNLSKLEAKNDNLRNDIEIMNIFRMYSFESTIPTNSSLRPNMNPIRAVLRCIGLYKNIPRKYLRFDPLTVGHESEVKNNHPIKHQKNLPRLKKRAAQKLC